LRPPAAAHTGLDLIAIRSGVKEVRTIEAVSEEEPGMPTPSGRMSLLGTVRGGERRTMAEADAGDGRKRRLLQLRGQRRSRGVYRVR
jgi:hypothetical protein